MASEKLNERNILALNENEKRLYAEVKLLHDRVIKLENLVANISADLSNTKQLIAHVSGRGMGPTVRE